MQSDCRGSDIPARQKGGISQKMCGCVYRTSGLTLVRFFYI